MAIPSVNMLSNLPGGAIPNVLDAHNTFAKNRADRRYSEAKAQYAPLNLQAQAASQLAYAKLMGPQYVSKLLQNEGILANLPDAEKKALLGMVTNAGVSATQRGNALGQLPQGNPQHTGVGQPSTNNFSALVKNGLMGLIGKGQQQQQGAGNPMAEMPSQVPDRFNNPAMNAMPGNRPKNGVMVEGQQWYDKNGNPVYEEEQIQEPGRPPMELELSEGQTGVNQPTWAEKVGRFKGEQKQGEESGKYRAEALRDIGKSQLALSGAGAAQDELIKVIKTPIWQHARDTIPAFQKQQLSILKVTGSPELRKLAGEYISAAQSMVASQVAGMGNRHLVREYDLAEKQKINDSDTIESSEGKLTNAKNLHDIAVKKNNIIKDLLKKGVDEADAVEIANKKVDVSAIRRATDKLFERKITIRNNKTGETKTMSVKEAQKLGVPNV